MKLQLLTPIVTVSALTFISTVATNTLANAQSTTFACGWSEGKPATLALTPYGNVPVIRWVSDYFTPSGYDPRTRCQLVSERFQEYYTEGTLTYLTTGYLNELPVICATSQAGEACNGLLFTLKPDSNPDRTLRELMAVRQRTGEPLNENRQRRYITEAEGRVSVNLREFLKLAPIDPEAMSNPPETRVTPSESDNGLW